ncbi:MAG: hypothetical protein KBH07_02395 [Flavobacteriales bacterium]|nr:hypothetical protein [Flavobacteriales bacterium]
MLVFKRRFLVPWLLSTVAMAGLSYAWHGWALNDVADLRMGLQKYLGISALVYLMLALVLTLLVHIMLVREWVSLKGAFPVKAMMVGAAFGTVVYLLVLLSGLSFADQGMHHVVVDLLWQVAEQGAGGLMVGLGVVYDLHRSFMEAERAS